MPNRPPAPIETQTNVEGAHDKMEDEQPSENQHGLTLSAEIDDRHFDAQQWPFFWLTQATGAYLSLLERDLKKVNLDVSRWRVLMCVPPGQARSISEIASLAIVKLPTMMKLIQRMQADGLVACEARASDGRVTEVRLTENGLDARKLAWSTAGQIFAKVFSAEDGLDLNGLNKLLRQLTERLEG